MADEARKKEVLKRIRDGVEKIRDSEHFRNWLRVQARFHRYSFGNSILIWSQMQDATKVAGIRTWNKLGRKVRKGEHGIMIFAPMLRKKEEKTTERTEDISEKEITDGRVKGDVLVGFRVAYVWDVSQTEGDPLPELCAPLSADVGKTYLDALVSIAQSREISVEFISPEEWPHGTAKGVHMKKASRIQVLRSLFSLDEFRVLVHELAHALDARDDDARDAREVTAESCSFIVCEHFSLDTSQSSFEYLASWSAGKDLDVFQESLEQAQRLARIIIDGLEATVRKTADDKQIAA